MKYLADDGSVFESEALCLEYERTRSAVEKVRAEVRHYLSMKEFKTEAARRRVETEIAQWIEHDTKQNPGRYGIEYHEPVVTVQAVPAAS